MRFKNAVWDLLHLESSDMLSNNLYTVLCARCDLFIYHIMLFLDLDEQFISF